MKKLSFLFLSFFAFTMVCYSQATPASMQHDAGAMTHVMINKAEFKWMDAPPALPKGPKVAVLNGDPGKEGPFTIRIQLPANYKVPPHWHPTTENVVVLQGTLYMGSGETLTETGATALTAGGFSSIPPKAPHFVFTKEPTEIQVYAEGPFAITYYNPADDPRKGQK